VKSPISYDPTALARAVGTYLRLPGHEKHGPLTPGQRPLRVSRKAPQATIPGEGRERVTPIVPDWIGIMDWLFREGFAVLV
jgi:hypothetical protein